MGLRSIFDGIYVDQLIQKNDQGDFTVYPYGIMGRGYVLPADREPHMRQRLRRLMLVSVVAGVVFAMAISRIAGLENAVSPLGWAAIIAIGAALFASLIYYQRRLARGLQHAPGPRPSVGEWLRRGRQSRPTWTYRFGVVAGLFLGLLSVLALGVGAVDGDALVIACSVFLLAISILAIWDGLLGLKDRRARAGA